MCVILGSLTWFKVTFSSCHWRRLLPDLVVRRRHPVQLELVNTQNSLLDNIMNSLRVFPVRPRPCPDTSTRRPRENLVVLECADVVSQTPHLQRCVRVSTNRNPWTSLVYNWRSLYRGLLRRSLNLVKYFSDSTLNGKDSKTKLRPLKTLYSSKSKRMIVQNLFPWE